MGMLDQETMLADGQTITAVGDNATTNVYDCGGSNGQSDMGLTGENLWFNARCRIAATSAGAATIQAVLQDSADGITFADAAAGAVVPVAQATAGANLFRTQPPLNLRRYVRGVIRIAGAALTAGQFDVYFSNTVQHNVARASGFRVQ